MAGAGTAVRQAGGAEPGAVAVPQAPRQAHPVLSLAGRRAAAGAVTLLVVSAAVFAATEVLPGNAANAVLGRNAAASPVALHRLEAALHLNRGLLDQYWIWFSGLFTGHLGHSLVNGQPVWGYIQPRLINSAVLMLVTGVIGAVIGVARRGLAVTGGEILLDGTDLLRLKPGQLRHLRGAKASYVPQDPAAALNPALRIGYQLRVHTGAMSDPDTRILEVLREARLDAAPDLLRRYPHQLSGGQQQRVGLAMAFACRPSLIVLDEPTTGLDVSTQRHILDTMRGLCRGYGVAAVYVSHDLAVVSELVTEVAVMYAGRIVEVGPASLLFPRPLVQLLLRSRAVTGEGGVLKPAGVRQASQARDRVQQPQGQWVPAHRHRGWHPSAGPA